jgi:hypothetical protein
MDAPPGKGVKWFIAQPCACREDEATHTLSVEILRVAECASREIELLIVAVKS